MIGRIDLAALRERADYARERASVGLGVDPKELLPLIDAVEAANAYFPVSLVSNAAEESVRRSLRAALGRFDFGDAT